MLTWKKRSQPTAEKHIMNYFSKTTANGHQNPAGVGADTKSPKFKTPKPPPPQSHGTHFIPETKTSKATPQMLTFSHFPIHNQNSKEKHIGNIIRISHDAERQYLMDLT